MRKYSSIYMYIWIYKYSASWLSLPENWPSSIYTHTHTHVFMFVFVFAVRVHSMCPVTFSSTTFWLSFWLILFCLLLLGCVCVCVLCLALAHSFCCYLFILPASFGSQVPKGKYCAYAACVRPSAKSISDCPTNTMYIQMRVCVCSPVRTGQTESAVTVTRSCTIFWSILSGNETPICPESKNQQTHRWFRLFVHVPERK